MKRQVNESLKGARVFVGLSGGVDSSVTAALLAHAGANVTGVFIKGWYPPGMPCTWAEDRRDAMRVAAYLRVPFATLDASAEYKASVIDYLIREYRAGRTPNPDIMCNRDVKFGAFHRFAKEHGADYLATGHYARVQHAGNTSRLLRGIDEDKDQSYFLWAVPPEALADTLFPLGSLRKEEVRARASRLNLPTAMKKDSQGICFLGPVSMDDFLRAEVPHEPGVALDPEGTEVGRHEGAVLYTLGERIALTGATPGPWYVRAKDLLSNTLTVSRERLLPQEMRPLRLTETNWFVDPASGDELTAQYRYHGPVVAGTYMDRDYMFTPNAPFSEPVAAGQSLVLYREDECIGGGIIE